MKNYTTPRQMRDGQWTLGSVSATPSSGHPSTLVIAVILVLFCALVAFQVIP
jgi:hypothetical protein